MDTDLKKNVSDPYGEGYAAGVKGKERNNPYAYDFNRPEAYNEDQANEWDWGYYDGKDDFSSCS